jgi:16S rRNA G527 N7-methylase RsmG
MTLVEANSRKWAFLEAACRRAALPCRCLNARVEAPLPEDLPPAMDLLTARALRLDGIVEALESRLRRDATVLFWAGGDERFKVPSGWQVRREVPLARSTRRRIVELGRR